MKFTWCSEKPCTGVTCPRTLKWYGHATLGMTKPAGDETARAQAVASFAEDIARSRPPGTDDQPRLVPRDAEFEIHEMVAPDGKQYWTALYSGEIPPMRMLDPAEPWSEQGAEANVAAALAELHTDPPPARRRAW